jgi:hypothetical protein
MPQTRPDESQERRSRRPRRDDVRLGNLAAVLLSIVALVGPAVAATDHPRADDFNVVAHLVRALGSGDEG